MASTSSYKLVFSDPTKTSSITVVGASLGSGVNNTSTSLSLIGPGYANYGLPTAQNFLKLLENFASIHPPSNAIEGQLWYDTSNPSKKILRVNNGTANSTRWPSASGIYQQPNDPGIEYSQSIIEGDLWADTTNNQLKIRHSGNWTVVGPTVSSTTNRTGNETSILESSTGTSYPVILNWVDGKVVEIISYNEFIPKIVIDGFSLIKAGTNLTSKVSSKYNGLSDRASSLQFFNGGLLGPTEILRNRSTSQTHTGTFIVESGNGLYVRNPTYNRSVRIYNTTSGGIIDFTDATSTLQIGIQTASFLKFNAVYSNIGLNTSTIATSPTLDVYGSGRFNNTLTVVTSAALALDVGGGASVSGQMLVGGNLSISGVTTATGKLLIGSTGGSGAIIEPAANDRYDIGTTSTAFRKLFVSQIGSTGTNVNIYGTVYGSTTALASRRNFTLQGQVTATIQQTFNGDADVVFTATITPSVISAQVSASVTTATQTLLILNTSTGVINPTLEKISKLDFLSDIYASIFQPGMIMPIGTSTAFAGFVACDGSEYTATDPLYNPLYNVIHTDYGTPSTVGKFKVPKMDTLTTATGGFPIYYQIKI